MQHRLCILTLMTILPQSPAAGQLTATLLDRSIAAMGGAHLENLNAIRVTGIGFANALEQSERPEGPWIKTFEQFTALRDLQNNRERLTRQSRSSPWSPDWSRELAVVADSSAAVYHVGPRTVPGRAQDRDAAMASMMLSPERIVLTARNATDVHTLTDTTIAGVRNNRVGFRWAGRSVELLIDANTSLPSGYIIRGLSDATFEWIWGDATRAVWYSLWSLDPPGIRYPRMMVEEFNGQPLREVAFTNVAFDPPAPSDSFAIPDSLRTMFTQAARMFPSPRTITLGQSFRGEPLPPIEPVAGVTIIPGTWHVALVKQDDGIIVLEAPISSEYSAQVLVEAARRHPGLPVKAVVTTSDAWPHMSGVREYVAREIPIYHFDLNRPILARLVAARYSTKPDSLQRARRQPTWRAVTEPVTIGTGENRVDIIPVHGEGGERMLVAYLPAHRLLYASDLIQKQPDGTFWSPQYLSEVVAVVERHSLDVETVFAMHTNPIPWEDVLQAVTRAWGESGTP